MGRRIVLYRVAVRTEANYLKPSDQKDIFGEAFFKKF